MEGHVQTFRLLPKEASAQHWSALHQDHVAPLKKSGWASIVAEGDDAKLVFETRCAQLVEIPREQLQDFRNMLDFNKQNPEPEPEPEPET